MNLFSIDAIKNNLEMTTVLYRMQKSSHSETLELHYIDHSQDNKEKVYYFNKKAPISTIWMQVLDLNMPDDTKTADTIIKLHQSAKLLCLAEKPSSQNITDFINGLDEDAFLNIAKRVLALHHSTIKDCPIWGYLYPLYFSILHQIYQGITEKTAPESITESIFEPMNILYAELSTLSDVHLRCSEYVNQVLYYPDATGIRISPLNAAAIYHSHSLAAGEKDFHTASLESMTWKRSILEADHDSSWGNYLMKYSAFADQDKYQEYPINSLEQFLHIGIDEFINSEVVVRQCKLCQGYFRIKYSSSQEYCGRIYKDTSTPCNEYASRKSYKERLFQHPIHQEFTKSYNKLYGRIRRGKVPADTPLMDQLKALHDEYYNKYEERHHQEREAIWREYIERNRELLK